VEVRRGVNQTPTPAAYKQYAWDLRYIDAPVCRWWDGDGDGTMEPASGEMQYFTNDGNFNTTALIDANSGAVVERYQYDPYGRPTVLNGAAGAEKDPNVSEWSPDADNKSDWDNDVLYCGYQYDHVTGLYHVRERYYDPITGTWKTRDKILYPDGMNLYEYVTSSPTCRLDAMGLAGATSQPSGEHWIRWNGDYTWYLERGSADSFDGLIKLDNYHFGMQNTSNNWVCIRPMKEEVSAEVNAAMEKAWAQKKPATCGVYETLNLNDQLPQGADIMIDVGGDPGPKMGNRTMVVDRGGGGLREVVAEPGEQVVENPGWATDNLRHFIMGESMAAFLPIFTGQEAAERIMLEAGHGDRPLASLIVIGHGSMNSSEVGTRSGKVGSGLHAGQLYRAGSRIPSYENAVSRTRLPPLCWFRHDAEVTLAGCETSYMAEVWARDIMRQGATVSGTIKILNAEQKTDEGKPAGYEAWVVGDDERSQTWGALEVSKGWAHWPGRN
jgi:RHS repeat-associated protein